MVICSASPHLQADKLSITQQLGVQVRDLRLLDPAMATSYPSAILCRDKALLVNMEHIKCIITTGYLLLLNADQPSVLQFAEDVRYRLTNTMHPHAHKNPPPVNTKPQKKGNMMRTSKSDSDLETYLLINQSASSDTSSISHKSYEDTPFELKALEAVLDTVQPCLSTHLEVLCLSCTINSVAYCGVLCCYLSWCLAVQSCASLDACLLQVCAKLSGMTDELWRAGDPVLRSPTVHTVRLFALFLHIFFATAMLACDICVRAMYCGLRYCFDIHKAFSLFISVVFGS